MRDKEERTKDDEREREREREREVGGREGRELCQSRGNFSLCRLSSCCKKA